MSTNVLVPRPRGTGKNKNQGPAKKRDKRKQQPAFDYCESHRLEREALAGAHGEFLQMVKESISVVTPDLRVGRFYKSRRDGEVWCCYDVNVGDAYCVRVLDGSLGVFRREAHPFSREVPAP